MKVMDQRVSLRAKSPNYVPVKRCMNCGNELIDNAGGIDGRRFCSTTCKGEYMTGPK